MTGVIVVVLCGLTTVCAGMALGRSRRSTARSRLVAGVGVGPSAFMTRLASPVGYTVVGAVVVAVGLSPPLAPLGAIGGLVIPGRIRAASVRRQAMTMERQLPEALATVARSLRTGATIQQALADAADATPPPLGPELARTVHAAAAGGMERALDGLVERQPLAGIRLLAAALCLGGETGGPLARGIDGVATTLRQRLGVQGEAAALSTQARLSGWLIAGAPVAFGGLAGASDPAAARWLLHTPVGLGILVTGLGLDLVGAWWMTALTRRIR